VLYFSEGGKRHGTLHGLSIDQIQTGLLLLLLLLLLLSLPSTQTATPYLCPPSPPPRRPRHPLCTRSAYRRMAWIVRYCPTGTRVQPGLRGSFGVDYKFIPVAGKGVSSALPEPDRERYAPCFGNSAALKK
jgi:hypothetical protein